MTSRPVREIRAHHDAGTITVYQAYPESIATPAVDAQRLVAPFRMDRMTWIKPSFLWMMYRSGWASKPGQERVLAVVVERSGFDWALSNAVLSHFDPAVHATPEQWREAHRDSDVVVQWDPERDVALRPLPYRAIQIGLRRGAVARYVNEWTVSISDVTDSALSIAGDVRAGRIPDARSMLPSEHPYEAPLIAAERLHIDG